MWPFSEMPLSLAIWLYDLANFVLICSLVAGVIATFVIVKSGNVKEHHWDILRKEADERIAEANARAAEANRIAEGERLARIKLEKEMAWRSLDSEQVAKLVSELNRFAGQPFEIITYPNDPEALSFSRELTDALAKAGWRPEQSNGFLGFQVEIGITIEVAPRKMPDLSSTVKALSEALNAFGISAKTTVRAGSASNRPNTVKIRVGKKPERASR
jgi:hypothetical protein